MMGLKQQCVLTGLAFFALLSSAASADPAPTTIVTHNPDVPVSFGVSIDDVEAAFPEMIWTDGETLRQGINYLSFIAPLLAAVRQLSHENEELRGEVAGLKSRSPSPAAPDQHCTAGQSSVDETFLYTCMSTGTWRRFPMQTWSSKVPESVE